MTGAVLAALLGHWRRRPVQALTLVLGLALATALWSGVQAINSEARASYERAADALGDGRPVIELEGGLSDQDFVALKRSGWQVTPIVEGRLRTHGSPVRLLGIDPLSAPSEIAAAGSALEGDLLSFLAPPGRLLAAPETARDLGADLPPVTEAPDMAPGIVLGDVGTVQRILERPGELDRLIVLDGQPLFRPALADVVPGAILQEGDTAGDLARLTDSFHLNLTAFGLLAFAVGLFIVHGAIGLAFEQRRGTIRTLRAIGVPATRLALLVGLELLSFAFLAGAIGVVLGYAIAAALLPDVAATLRGLYGVPASGVLNLRAEWWVSGLGIAVLGTSAAAGGALLRVARLPVLAPAQPRAWARADSHVTRMQALAALALAALATEVAVSGPGLLGGFVSLGAMLLGAALVLPAVLAAVIAFAERSARTVTGEWFWADMRHALPGLSLALMALLLALAANIGVGTMVSSFRATFVGWLDQRLASELYVEARDVDEAERLAAWLVQRADAVLPIWHVHADLLGRPAEVYGVADHATYRDNWPLLDALPEVWSRVADGSGVLINEQLARAEGLAPGDTLPLPGWTGTIAGIYSDYGNPEAQAIVGVDTLVARFPDVERLRYGIRTDAPDGLIEELVEEFGLPAGRITDQATLKSFSLSVFDRTFAVTAALKALTLGVAAIAILTALLTLSSMRLVTLAPVWALGVTRRRLAATELLRTVVLGALTFVVAVPVGLLLAWLLLAVVNVAAFGWRLPLQIFPLDWLRLGLLALLAAVVAGAWPAWRLAHISPSDLARVFSSER